MKTSLKMTIFAASAILSAHLVHTMDKDKYLMICKVSTDQSITLYRVIPKDISVAIFTTGRFKLDRCLKRGKYCYTLPNPSGVTTDSEKAKVTFEEVDDQYVLQSFSECLEMFKEKN